MNHGQSAVTIQKEGLFTTFLGWEFNQLVREFNRRAVWPPYFVCDLNCGSGENRHNGANVFGSPLLAKRHLEKHKIPGQLFLCDKSSRALKAVRRYFSNDGQRELFRTSIVRASFIHSNNRDFVPTIPERIREAGEDPHKSHGIIIADPNGLHVPLAEIAACLWECPRFDVLIHLSAIKRVWAYWKKHPESTKFAPGPDSVQSVSQIFNMISRTWLLTAPFGSNGANHMVLFGSHRAWVPEIRNRAGRPNAVWLKSAEGRCIVASLEGLEEVI